MPTAYTSPGPAQPTSPSTGGRQAFHLHNGHHQHMDGRQSEYPQSEQQSAAQYSQGQDPRSANFSSSATPTSEYGIAPSSARSGSFPDYIQRPHYTPTGQGPAAGGMAQATNPSIAAASPTYPPQPQYSPYQPQPDMSHYSAAHPGVYGRPEWAQGQYPSAPAPIAHYGHPTSSGPPSAGLVSPGAHPLSTVYSFVPIPGAQQHKRPRRRYEEIERMYKCGWNGCEKAYGTLNHLNAHVTMQSHGSKRTPEEFKEIRKEWKAKKKEEEIQRKAEEERQRAADNRNVQEGSSDASVYGHLRTPIGPPPSMGGPQLPPIGYAPAASGQSQPSYGAPSPAIEGISQYASANNHVYGNGNNKGGSYPQSPYGQNNQMYQQQDSGSNFQQ